MCSYIIIITRFKWLQNFSPNKSLNYCMCERGDMIFHITLSWTCRENKQNKSWQENTFKTEQQEEKKWTSTLEKIFFAGDKTVGLYFRIFIFGHGLVNRAGRARKKNCKTQQQKQETTVKERKENHTPVAFTSCGVHLVYHKPHS